MSQPSTSLPHRVAPPRNPRRRSRAAAGVAAAALLGAGLAGSPSAAAGEPLSAVSTTAIAVPANSTTALPGVALNGASSDDTYNFIVSTDVGDLTLGTTTGLTATYGYAFSGPTVAFTGGKAAANADFPSLTLTTGNAVGRTAHIRVSVSHQRSDVVYSPSNQHYYEYVADPAVTWSAAQTDATSQNFGGMPGYLATIPDDAVNDFVASKIQGASNVWFGAAVDANDTSYPRVWKWTGGPLAGGVVSTCSTAEGTCDFVTGTDGLDGHSYSHWADVEPNNYGGTEHVAVDNWQGTAGDWNDLSNDPGVGIEGYLVEFGDRAVGNSFQPGGTSSAVSSVTIYGPPDAPTGLVAAPGDGRASVRFRAPANDGGSPVTGFQVSLDGGRTWVDARTLRGARGTLIAPLTGLTNGTTYRVEVRAVNAAGHGPASAAAPVTPVSPEPTVIAPGTPNPVTVTPGLGRLTVHWTTPSQVGRPAMTGYLVTVTDLTTSTTRTIRVGLVLHTTVTGAIAGHRYTATVAAFSPARTGAAATATSAVTSLPMPEPALTVPAVVAMPTHRTAVTCSVTTGRLRSCAVVLTARLGGHTVVVGHGHQTVPGRDGTRRTPVTVVLTPRGRVLAARVGGVPVTVSAAIRVPGLAAPLHTTGRTRLVTAVTVVPRAIYFASGSAKLTPDDRSLLTALRGRLGGVTSVLCAGFTDNRDTSTTNITLGVARARATCSYLLAGTHIHAVVRSFGEAHPAASNGTPAGRALNRRTELALEY